MDFVRESFWRGYSFTDLETANRDLAAWLSEKAERVHGTTHERVDARFVREKPHLLALPPSLCDVSERLFREVRKDCTIPVYGNRYVVEHTLVGRKVLVRLRGKELRVFDDNRLVVSYAIPEGKGHLVQDPRFYAALRADRELQARKFGSSSGKSHKPKGPKGRAWMKTAKTIGPLTPKNPIDVSIDVSAANVADIQSSLEVPLQVHIEVERRSMSAYAQLGGEVSGEVGYA
jgi:hypothetical protein